jgi:hypothetical protein
VLNSREIITRKEAKMRFTEPTQKELSEHQEWLAGRPEHIRKLAERFEPWSLYRLKSTGQRVTIAGYREHRDGKVSLTVDVSGKFNEVPMNARVFEIEPDDLSPCELPGPLDPVGVTLNEDGQLALVNEMRAGNGLPPLTHDEAEKFIINPTPRLH